MTAPDRLDVLAPLANLESALGVKRSSKNPNAGFVDMRDLWAFEGNEVTRAIDAVRELLEADREYDEANLALQCFDSTGMDAAEEDAAYDALCQRFNTARDRRAAALAALSGGEDGR